MGAEVLGPMPVIQDNLNQSMAESEATPPEVDPPKSGKVAKISRGALQVISGAVPLAGGLLSAIAGAWSEAEQERFNRFFEHWIRMLRDELKEKEQTVLEIMARLDLHDEEIAKRVESADFGDREQRFR